MRSPLKTRKLTTKSFLAAAGAIAVMLLNLAPLAPANAQFWGGSDNRQRQQNNGFFNWGWGDRERERDRDLSRAVDRVRERFGDEAIRTGPPRGRPIGEKGARKPRG